MAGIVSDMWAKVGPITGRHCRFLRHIDMRSLTGVVIDYTTNVAVIRYRDHLDDSWWLYKCNWNHVTLLSEIEAFADLCDQSGVK